MNIEHISVSRKSVWDTCHEQYKFKYHLKTPVEGPEPIYFAYGKMVHKIAEEYVSRGDPNAFNDIVNDVRSGKIEIQEGQVAPKLDSEYSKKFINHCKNLKNFTAKIGLDQPGDTEYQFTYDLLPPKKYNVTGFIDRIVIKGNKYFILDYKTTKKGPWRKNHDTVLHDLQLRLYANVIHRNFGVDPQNIHCCLFYLDGGEGEVVGATYNLQALKEAEKELLEAYIQIHEMDPNVVRGTVGAHCNRCDFKKQCRFYSNANQVERNLEDFMKF
jgi:RecB family exonuclease